MLLYRLRKSQHYRQHVNLEQQNTWIYYLKCSKCLPPTTHIATSSTTVRHVCTYCLTKTTKLSLFTAFRFLNIRVSGDYWDTRYTDRNKTFTFAIQTQNHFLTQANIRETEWFESSGMLRFLHDKAAVLRQTIKETPCSSRRFEGL